jgi:energy-coupling factor transporter ATP-binding protein EcfA2
VGIVLQQCGAQVDLSVNELMELIFLDEPTTGCDPAARRQAWSTIRSLCQRAASRDHATVAKLAKAGRCATICRR